jgi:hypothetical protein
MKKAKDTFHRHSSLRDSGLLTPTIMYSKMKTTLIKENRLVKEPNLEDSLKRSRDAECSKLSKTN